MGDRVRVHSIATRPKPRLCRHRATTSQPAIRTGWQDRSRLRGRRHGRCNRGSRLHRNHPRQGPAGQSAPRQPEPSDRDSDGNGMPAVQRFLRMPPLRCTDTGRRAGKTRAVDEAPYLTSRRIISSISLWQQFKSDILGAVTAESCIRPLSNES